MSESTAKEAALSREELDAELAELRALAETIRRGDENIRLQRDQLYAKIVRLFKRGAHYGELAQAAGFSSHQRIYQILDQAGLQTRPRKSTKGRKSGGSGRRKRST